ncbi:hypothetical protein U6A24_13525 [Aquimarina gracilis]|uniref:Lipoprotein n=1 Tax=Aquimarina gracilis TaxID=874422 RepID=A0ABU5ZXD7_9FLAO|nr:hypothetical protein [Aquimarina gracilis]MEB3346492.1 hypothetical protein [Aquimarina gracilis]
MTIFNRNWFRIAFLFVGLTTLFTSCYSVRLVSTHGAYMPCQTGIEPECIEDHGNFYRDKRVVVIDTVVKSSAFIDKIGLKVQQSGCETGKLFSVEYKNTFGGSLLYLVSFGSKRKVRIKYVCMKPEN